ncbi:uncharacterized protein B0H18DRAFT_1213604 [Fomitopsis serialis]|uniref:uncharacterized protein n=1 Tax=Fomitopsis serialis TaxID=139415 RepID=UPI0020078FE0|nr:uncharacterized protein B0H18DRAFT_1213604 [Neoantrodia serialis]KAH9919929.1 hypothetical protein B0H18DRAFT_1213604 [Neoantrodia serialis]
MVNIDIVAQLFASCMKDPARPKGCARALCGCLHLLDGEGKDDRFALFERYFRPNDEHYEHLRKTYPEYLSACAAFLSQPRSTQDEEELEVSLQRCSCSAIGTLGRDQRVMLGWLHTFEVAHKFALDDFIQALVRHLAGILHNAVKTKTVGGVSAKSGLKRNRKKHAGSPLWPVDASQLLPHGLEQSMKGYADSFRWCPPDRFHDGLSLVGNLLSICGRSMIPHLLQFLPDMPLRVTGLTTSLCQERMATLGAPVDFEVERSWACTFLVLMDFCRTIMNLGEWNPADISLFVRVAAPYKGSMKSLGLLFVCDTILNHLPPFREGTTLFDDKPFGELAVFFARFGAMFYSHRPPDDTTVYHEAILHLHAQLTDSFSDPVQVAWEGFAWLSTIRRCCAPGCPKTFASAQRTFARCAGCGVPRYCSRECQKHAWKDAAFPHKDVCAKLRAFKERTNLGMKDHALTESERQLFIDACRADEELTTLAQECGAHLWDMRKARGDESVPEAFGAFQARLATRGDSTTTTK